MILVTGKRCASTTVLVTGHAWITGRVCATTVGQAVDVKLQGVRTTAAIRKDGAKQTRRVFVSLSIGVSENIISTCDVDVKISFNLSVCSFCHVYLKELVCIRYELCSCQETWD